MRNSPLSTLSGGERGRVMLAKLLLEGGNLIALDEPTNDLDLATLRALEESLMVFPGAALVVTHDRWFLDRIATHVLYVDGAGGTRLHHGDVSALISEITAERESARLAEQRARREEAAVAGAAREAAAAPNEAKKKRLTPWQEKELEELMLEVAETEERVSALDATLASPDLYAAGSDPGRAREIQAERDAAAAKLEGLMARWEELEDLAG